MRANLIPCLLLLFSIESAGQIMVSSEFTVPDLELGKTSKKQLIEKYGTKYTLSSDSIARHASFRNADSKEEKTIKVKIGETIQYEDLGMSFFVGPKWGDLYKITLTPKSKAATTTGIKVGISTVKDVIGVYGDLTNPPKRITDPHWIVDDEGLTIFYDGIRFVVNSVNLKTKSDAELMNEVIDTFVIVKKIRQR